jgi:hypothetical protein
VPFLASARFPDLGELLDQELNIIESALFCSIFQGLSIWIKFSVVDCFSKPTEDDVSMEYFPIESINIQ